MGLEAYLFQIAVRKKITMTEIERILKELNFKKIKQEFHSINYEQVNNKSIIELQVLFSKTFFKTKIEAVFVRFCVSNPLGVIDDLFLLFEKMSAKTPIKVYDFQAEKVVYFEDREDDKYVRKTMLKKKKVFDTLYGKVDIPIRCDDVWDYVKKKGGGKVIKWLDHIPIENEKPTN